jgi:diguanylate cyclase (GGDEF)-like protein
MPETMTERAWRLDSVGAHPAASDTYKADATPEAVTVSIDSASGPIAARSEGARFIERWRSSLQTWTTMRLERLGLQTSRFEDVVHEFTGVIEAADNPVALETALLREAQRLVPGCRIELITAPAGPDDHDMSAAGDGTRESGQGQDRDRQSIVDVALRCGPVARGRLRIRTRGRGAASLSRETIQRLTTLCTLSACALERLDHLEVWPPCEAIVSPDESAGANPAPSGGPACATFVNSTQLHDATFLNAVLPFAFNQARRHNEMLSLVCVAIDRLGGIQELMGRAVVDRLVQSVGETVAVLIRASDIVARLDDDRIVAVLPRAPGGGALHVAQRICEVVRDKSAVEREMPRVTVSIGVATFPSCADNVLSLFDAADVALARAQSEGRNRASLSPRRMIAASSQAAPVSP